jgi:hypothetical protein
MSYDRLKTSERNRIIAAFTEGKPDPNYDVIPSKTQKGKYTIRKKLQNPNKKAEEAQPTEDAPSEVSQPDIPNTEGVENEEEPAQEEEDYNPYLDDSYYYPKTRMTKAAMFREMQMALNRMMLEQMKMLRRDQKRTEAKRKKYGTKTKKIHNILSSIAYNDDQIPQIPEATDKEEVEEYFTQKEPLVPPPEPDDPDAQPYDEQLQDMAAEPVVQSRRDKLKAFI